MSATQPEQRKQSRLLFALDNPGAFLEDAFDGDPPSTATRSGQKRPSPPDDAGRYKRRATGAGVSSQTISGLGMLGLDVGAFRKLHQDAAPA